MELLKFVILQAVFIALEYFFSASDTAVISLDESKLRRQAADGDRISAIVKNAKRRRCNFRRRQREEQLTRAFKERFLLTFVSASRLLQ